VLGWIVRGVASRHAADIVFFSYANREGSEESCRIGQAAQNPSADRPVQRDLIHRLLERDRDASRTGVRGPRREWGKSSCR
jgi:hypothetical protein